jgi:hypothetical protein
LVGEAGVGKDIDKGSKVQPSLTSSQMRVTVDGYEKMDLKSRAELQENLRSTEAPAGKNVLFGTMSKVTAVKDEPDNELLSFLSICYTYGGQGTDISNTLRDGELQYVEPYTVRASEIKNELHVLGDGELLERVFMMGATHIFALKGANYLMQVIEKKRIHDKIGCNFLSLVKGPIWSVGELNELAVYLEAYYKRSDEQGIDEGGSE